MKKRIPYFLFLIAFALQIGCNENAVSEKTGKEEISERDYLAEGKKIAAETFGVLGGQLQKAMKEGGVAQAVSYCNLAATPLTDSLSKVHNAVIRRTTLKPRNPKDAPTSSERFILENYEKSHKAGIELTPYVEAQGSEYTFFAPIFTNDLCLRCHGKIGETLSEENYAHILENYPDDKAVGYEAGDLRGMWSIKFYSGKR